MTTPTVRHMTIIMGVSHTHTHTHTHSLSHTHTYSHTLTLSLSHIHTHSLSLTHTLTLSHTPTLSAVALLHPIVPTSLTAQHQVEGEGEEGVKGRVATAHVATVNSLEIME